jgi:hypothetical protein
LRVATATLDPHTGLIQVLFQDPVAIDASVLMERANYQLTDARTGHSYPLAAISAPAAAGVGDTYEVDVTFGLPRGRKGRYLLTLSCAGLFDQSGIRLDPGTFVAPAGPGGAASGNFVAEFITNGRNRTSPVPVSTHSRRPRLARRASKV